MKRLICLVIGHEEIDVATVIHTDGEWTYYSRPEGDRTACSRCHRILKEN